LQTMSVSEMSVPVTVVLLVRCAPAAPCTKVRAEAPAPGSVAPHPAAGPGTSDRGAGTPVRATPRPWGYLRTGSG
jgi:hypothetical protein